MGKTRGREAATLEVEMSSQKWGCYSTPSSSSSEQQTPALPVSGQLWPCLGPAQGRIRNGISLGPGPGLHIAMPLLRVTACVLSLVVSEHPRVTLPTSPFKQYYAGVIITPG